jgi:hypothetical protein
MWYIEIYIVSIINNLKMVKKNCMEKKKNKRTTILWNKVNILAYSWFYPYVNQTMC